MKTKWTILLCFLTISNVFAFQFDKNKSLKTCQEQIKLLCGKEDALDGLIKCVKSHEKEIPKECLEAKPEFEK